MWSAAIPADGVGQLATATPRSAGQPGVPGGTPQNLPAHTDLIGRIIIRSVRIDGQGPFRFMLDTGANHTVLASSVLQRLRLVADDRARIPVVGVAGSTVVTIAHVTSLDAGAVHFGNVDLPVLEGPVFQGIDGIIGMDALADKQLSANFLTNTFGISTSHNLRAPEDYAVVPVTFLSQRLLMIQGRVGRVRTRAIIDTGGQRTLGNLALMRALERHHDAGLWGAQTGVLDATQNSQAGRLGLVWNANFAGTTINNLVVVFGDFNIFKTWHLDKQPALLIGMDVLGTLADLRIDYRRRELQIKLREQSVPTLQMR